MIECSITKRLHGSEGDFALRLDLRLERGQILALYGPSGVGKTSTLRMLAGLLDPDDGVIRHDGSEWFNKSTGVSLKAGRRNVGYVFQDYALFPNLNVRQQLEYALPDDADPAFIDQLLSISGLTALSARKPVSLSGGQKQRVAVTRALVRKPSLLLLDEPLAALDRATRRGMQDLLLRLHREFRPTVILVTHDVGEIWKLADTVAILSNGTITEMGAPREVFLKNTLSGKFQFVGEVLEISREGVLHVLTLLVENQVSKVVADQEIGADLAVGDRVVVASKAFNPIVQKIV